MKTLAIDFDGVIHNKAVPVPGRRMGEPMENAKSAMEHLRRRGYKLVVHTVMAVSPGGQKAVEDWLNYYDVPFHEVTAIKPSADNYIDDKGIHFDNWPQVMQAIGERNYRQS